MKTVKQILEHYNIYNHKHLGDKLKAVADAGLLDENKLHLLKNAMLKEASFVTNAEKKVYEEIVESLITEKKSPSLVKAASKSDEPPLTLILRRKAVRTYPDKQTIALYYSQPLDRYFSIPFEKGTSNMGIPGIHMMEEKKKDDDDLTPYQKQMRKQVEKGARKQRKLKDIAANISDREAAEDPELWKARKQVVKKKGRSIEDMAYNLGRGATMSAIKWLRDRRKTGAQDDMDKPSKVEPPKTVTPEPERPRPTWTRKPPKRGRKPPGAAAGPPMRKTDKPEEYVKSSVSESFRGRLNQIREEKEELDEALPVIGAAVAGARMAAPYISRALASRASKKASGKMISGMSKAGKAGEVANKVSKGGKITDPARLARRKAIQRQLRNKRLGRGKKGGFLAGLSTGMAGGGGKNDSASKSSEPIKLKDTTPSELGRKLGTVSAGQRTADRTSDYLERQRAKNVGYVAESSNFDIIKTVAEDNAQPQMIYFNNDENHITINNRMAKKIMTIHESLNRTNKRKIEAMLNEDVQSFRKVINFAIRQ